MPYELAAECRREQHVAVAREPRDGRAGGGLHDGQRGAGALHLARGRGEQLPRGGRLEGEDGRHTLGAELVPYGELEHLALLGRGARRFGPGQKGEFPLVHVGRRTGGCPGFRGPQGRCGPAARGRLTVAAPRVSPLTPPALLREPAEAGPARQRVQPRLALPLRGRGPAVVPLGEGQDVTQHVHRRVVVTQHGEAVGEQAVQIGLVARGRARWRRTGRTVGRVVRAACVHGGLGTAAHHLATVD
jgi:hypothetical protein